MELLSNDLGWYLDNTRWCGRSQYPGRSCYGCQLYCTARQDLAIGCQMYWTAHQPRMTSPVVHVIQICYFTLQGECETRAGEKGTAGGRQTHTRTCTHTHSGGWRGSGREQEGGGWG
jgi:hypothetical protein